MLAIPAEIQTLLKSKVMVGENRPTATLTIEGQPDLNGGSLLDPTTWTTWRAFTTSGKAHGNIAETSDGKCVVVYVQSDNIYMAFAPSVAGILSGTEAFDYDNAVLLKSDPGSSVSASIALIDGKLNVAISYFVNEGLGGYNPGYAYYEFWRDTDGTGTGMSKVSDIGHSTPAQDSHDITIIHRLNDGTLVIIGSYSYNYSVDGYVYYSADNGATWTKGAYIDHPYYMSGLCGTFMLVNDTSFICSARGTNGSTRLFYVYNSGANVTIVDWGTWESSPSTVGFVNVNDSAIYVAEKKANYEIRLMKLNSYPASTTNMKDEEDWSDIVNELQSDSMPPPPLFTLTAAALILQHSTGDIISGAGTLAAVSSDTIPLKSVIVDRVKGGASQATAVIDNTGGYYAPDNNTSPFYQVIWPNKYITITMGYGAEQVTVFKGLIDKISMRNYPAELTIQSRDYAKRALDQIAQMFYVDHQAYVILYQSQSPEYIFTDLATKAGWAAGNIHTDTSGLILGEFTASHETYADCFQRLAELTGWEWYCDQAEIYFQAAVDPAPVADYVYSEGDDIFSLGYDFDDSELYRDIVVWSMDGGDPPAAVRATVEWSAADYNNVLAHKTLIVRAPETVLTVDQCEWLAQQIANSITPKPRSVDFVVVGNPYLQMGDCLQVIETTTTISELYRIFEVSFAVVADAGNGSPFFANTIRCYHYAYAEVPESVPEPYVAPDPPLVVPDDYEAPTFPVYPGGGIDVTADIQAQIDAAYAAGGGTVYLPDGEYWIDAETSIVLKSGVNLSLADNAILYALPNSAETYAIIKGTDVSNVNISGGQIVGDKNTHTGSTGEWGMGIGLWGCTNIKISNVDIYNCWGDGIYIGVSGTQNYCYNVVIDGFTVTNCRRNGISLISGKYITIKNGTISYTGGTLPMCGIDVEPNNNTEWLYNILIQNVVCNNNTYYGIKITFYFYGGATNEVSITLDGCTYTGNGVDPYVLDEYVESSTCHIYIT